MGIQKILKEWLKFQKKYRPTFKKTEDVFSLELNLTGEVLGDDQEKNMRDFMDRIIAERKQTLDWEFDRLETNETTNRCCIYYNRVWLVPSEKTD